MDEYAKNILGYDPSKPENYYQFSHGRNGFTIGQSKENAEHITVEKAIEKLAEYYAQNEINSGKHDRRIDEEAIKRTKEIRDWSVQRYGDKNQKINNAIENGDFPELY